MTRRSWKITRIFRCWFDLLSSLLRASCSTTLRKSDYLASDAATRVFTLLSHLSFVLSHLACGTLVLSDSSSLVATLCWTMSQPSDPPRDTVQYVAGAAHMFLKASIVEPF